MSIQNKSNEELLLELNDLRNQYDSLKTLYEACIYDKSIQDLALNKLYKYSLELLNITPIVDLEVSITRLIKELTGAKAAVFSEYNQQSNSLNVQHIEMEFSLLERVLSLIGKKGNKINAPVSREMYQKMTSETIGMSESLYEASIGAISRPISTAIQKLLKVKRFIALVFLNEGRLYGTTLLAIGKEQPDPPRQLLENIIFLATLILKRKKAEVEIQESEQRFRALFEGAPEAIVLADPNSMKIRDANRAASALIMKRHPELIGVYLYDLLPNQPAELIKALFDRQINEAQFLGFVKPVETFLKSSDDNLVPVEVTSQTIVSKGERVLMASFRNISERKKSELFMQQILAELQTLLDNIQQGVLLENENRTIQYSNNKFCEIFNIESPKNIYGNCGKALAEKLQFYFEDPSGFLTTIEKRLTDHAIIMSEEMKLADGRIFERDYIPVIDNGKINRNYWIYRDVTERKLAEKELIENQAYLSALINAIPDLMFIQSREGEYIDYHSPEGTHLYLSPQEFIGKNMNEILPDQLAEEFKNVFEKAIETGKIQNFEYSLNLPDRESYFESRTITYQKDKLLSLVRDITDRKLAELKIKQQNDELSKLNDDKNRFMSILAHDLKSPFNSILGFLDLLSDNFQKYDIGKIEKMVGQIKVSSEKFYHLLEDLLLWARSQSGKMLFEPITINFLDVCSEVLEELSSNAQTKNITIQLDNKKLYLLADLDMLKTIMRNLISNAIKFTPCGGKVEIYWEEGNEFAIIIVSDNGIGISNEKLNSLFNISITTSMQGTAGERGTGLGLFLCKELIEKHGGAIWVESELEKGSRFKFKLPLSKQPVKSI